jgi:hypothetical protein
VQSNAIQVLLEIAGAWWVSWCLSQHKLSLFQSVVGAAVHHTRDAQRYQTWLFVYKQKIYAGIFRRFLKKSGANVSKLYVESEDVIGRFS